MESGENPKSNLTRVDWSASRCFFFSFFYDDVFFPSQVVLACFDLHVLVEMTEGPQAKSQAVAACVCIQRERRSCEVSVIEQTNEMNSHFQ